MSFVRASFASSPTRKLLSSGAGAAAEEIGVLVVEFIASVETGDDVTQSAAISKTADTISEPKPTSAAVDSVHTRRWQLLITLHPVQDSRSRAEYRALRGCPLHMAACTQPRPSRSTLNQHFKENTYTFHYTYTKHLPVTLQARPRKKHKHTPVFPLWENTKRMTSSPLLKGIASSYAHAPDHNHYC